MSFPKFESASLSTSDMSQCIPGTAHTLSALIDALRQESGAFKAMAGGSEVTHVNADPIDGNGLMSSIYRVSFRLDNGQTFVAILKITTTAKIVQLRPMEIHAIDKANGHNKQTVGLGAVDQLRSLLFEMAELEANFYELVEPLIPPDWHIVPKAFAVRRSPSLLELERGYALIEDLSPKGLVPSLYNGLSEKQVESTIVQLAKFHAFSMSLPAEVLSRFKVKEYGSLRGLEEELAQRVLNLHSPYFHHHRKTLKAFFYMHNHLKMDVHKRLGLRPVLCHGDFWANNLFFTRQPDTDEGEQKAGDELYAIVDWQTCHANTGVNDVLRLIFTGVNAPLRKQNIDRWLDLYFDTVETEAHRLGVDSVQYSHEMRQKLYAEQSHFELTFAFMSIPTLTPAASTEKQRQNLLERLETLFEEGREQYEYERMDREGSRLCSFL